MWRGISSIATVVWSHQSHPLGKDIIPNFHARFYWREFSRSGIAFPQNLSVVAIKREGGTNRWVRMSAVAWHVWFIGDYKHYHGTRLNCYSAVLFVNETQIPCILAGERQSQGEKFVIAFPVYKRVVDWFPLLLLATWFKFHYYHWNTLRDCVYTGIRVAME